VRGTLDSPMDKKRKTKKRGDGEGSVFTVRGKWRAQLPYSSEGGVRKFITKSFGTKDEADRWMTERRYGRYQGENLAPDQRTVGAFLDEWLELHGRNVGPKTTRSYEDFVNVHLKPGLGHVRLQNLTTPMVQRFLNAKADEKKKDGTTRYAPSTVKHIRDTLRAALNCAVEWGMAKENPAKKACPPKPRQRTLRVLSQAEARKLLIALEHLSDGPMFRLILALGLRKGEALGLKVEDLELNATPPTIYIRNCLQAIGGKTVFGPAKTQSSVRRLPLSPVMAAAMKKHMQRRERLKLKAGDSWSEMEFVFTTKAGTPIYPRNVKRSLDRILKKAGISHLRVHDLRHSAATFAIADGVPAPYVQEMLGHSDIRTTLQVYTKLIPATLQDAVATLDRVTDKETDGKRKPPKRRLHVVENTARARSSVG
jgi:integrase